MHSISPHYAGHRRGWIYFSVSLGYRTPFAWSTGCVAACWRSSAGGDLVSQLARDTAGGGWRYWQHWHNRIDPPGQGLTRPAAAFATIQRSHRIDQLGLRRGVRESSGWLPSTCSTALFRLPLQDITSAPRSDFSGWAYWALGIHVGLSGPVARFTQRHQLPTSVVQTHARGHLAPGHSRWPPDAEHVTGTGTSASHISIQGSP